MLDISTFHNLSVARLEEMATADGGHVYVRHRRGREVRLAPHLWSAILDDYRAAVLPSRRRLRWAMILAIPFSIFLIVIMKAIPGLEAVVYAIDRTIPIVTLLIAAGLPIAAITSHVVTLQRAMDRARRDLDRHPHQAARPHPVSPGASPLEKLAAFVLIPHLLIQIYGSIDPDAYRNTPWTGTRFDVSGLAALAILGWLGWRRWRAARAFSKDQPAPREARSVDVVTRARRSAP